jgi:pyrroloquinoline quinone (PQQ) biosynthesis protein C
MASKTDPRLARLDKKLGVMANDVFKSDEYRHFFSIPLTRERAAYYIFQRSHFHLNRRQCWALVQAKAPFDVKQLIWDHESDELAGNAERGVENHWALGMKEGETVGLKPRDFKKPPGDCTLICAGAWAHIAETAPWLEAVAASGVLEIANSDAIVKGGGVAKRIAKKMSKELDIPLRKQHSNKEHMEVDVIHAALLTEVAERHVKDKADEDAVLSGATKSLAINRTWLGLMAKEMDRLN